MNAPWPTVDGPVLLVGAGNHAVVVSDIVRLLGAQIAGYVEENCRREGHTFCGAKILGGLDRLGEVRRHGVQRGVVAIGDCAARLRLGTEMARAGFDLIRAVHPRAVVAADVLVGAGTVVVAGAVINPMARIGAHVIVNTCASVDHHCVVHDGAHICPGARLAGNVTVGERALVGIGAVVREGVTIGAGTVVGAGSVVLEDLPPGMLVHGVPARVVRAVE